MRQNSKLLFGSLLKAGAADCVCDIGSRDGDQSLFFRQMAPSAKLFAFEANPLNFQAMQGKQALADAGVDVRGVAVSNENGSATFHVIDVDYDDPSQNRGVSSLLKREDLKEKMAVTVPAVRIDDFLLQHCPQASKIGLWIDVEGAEHLVLSGLEKIRDRVMAIHVECWRESRWEGQKNVVEITRMLEQQGFELCGDNLEPGGDFGDFVFINTSWRGRLGSALRRARIKGALGHLLKADGVAVFLKSRFPSGYDFLRRTYLKIGT